jgi:hypothetical protein
MWLESVSVGHVSEGHLHATEDWVITGLPAHSPKELARRVALRDPAYRLHLDFILVRVLSRMARDGRTAKIGDYLSSKLSHLAPRIAWLLSLVPDHPDEAHWADLETKWLHPSWQTSFGSWDAHLFGEVLGGPEQLFPLILDIYGPAGSDPVYACAGSLHLDRHQIVLLAELIRAANEREAVSFADRELKALQDLTSHFHLPIRMWKKTSETRACAALVSPLRLVASVSNDVAGSQVPAPVSLPASLKESSIISDRVATTGTSLRCAALEASRAGAFPGFDLNSASLTERLRFRSVAERADFAWSFDHPLFGLILQLFLIEAFGRELQDDCINILYVGGSENPESVDVYFRPESRESRFLRLGQFEDSMVALARALNILTVPPPFTSGVSGPWTRALLLLLQGRLLLARSGEYMISDELFDVLHGKDFMKDVLREGNPIRDRIVARLKGIYDEHARLEEPNVITANEFSR